MKYLRITNGIKRDLYDEKKVSQFLDFQVFEWAVLLDESTLFILISRSAIFFDCASSQDQKADII